LLSFLFMVAVSITEETLPGKIPEGKCGHLAQNRRVTISTSYRRTEKKSREENDETI